MKLRLNGENREFPQVQTLLDLLAALEIDPSKGGVAVALNNDVIPRTDLDTTTLHEEDRVEIVRAVQGG